MKGKEDTRKKGEQGKLREGEGWKLKGEAKGRRDETLERKSRENGEEKAGVVKSQEIENGGKRKGIKEKGRGMGRGEKPKRRERLRNGRIIGGMKERV